jgi:hypothetical protein
MTPGHRSQYGVAVVSPAIDGVEPTPSRDVSKHGGTAEEHVELATALEDCLHCFGRCL